MTGHLLASPFNNGVVPDARAEPVVEVASIHAEVSNQCLELQDWSRWPGTARSGRC